MSVHILTDQINITEEDTIVKTPFELNNFQKHAVLSINKNYNVLITAHTGSGKTIPAIHAIAHCLKNNKIAVYCSPIKSLSNEKYKEFREKFNDKFMEETGISVSIGILTGDNKINPDGNCLIMTTEILRNTLYKLKTEIDDSSRELKNNFLEKLGCVIFDEIHYINLPDRGHVWEESLILLPDSVQIIGLSATIDKPHDFASWLASIKNKNIALIPTDKRAVPLKHYIYNESKLYLVLDEKNSYNSQNYQIVYKLKKQEDKEREKKHKSLINYNLIPEVVEFLKKRNLLQAIFFSFSRNNCQYYASMITNTLLTKEEISSAESIFNFYMHKYEKQYSMLQQYQEIKKLLYKGVAFHHSGLLPILKEIVEILFHKGLIKVLFATETFAVGVNMPTRTVVFTELEKFTDGKKRFLESHEYKQMAGRAGRRGLDTVGFTIYLPLYSIPEETSFRAILMGKVPTIQSKFYIDYSFFLKIIQSQVSDFDQFMNMSLYFKQHSSSIEFMHEERKKYKLILDDYTAQYNSYLDKIDTSIINKMKQLFEYHNTNTFIKPNKSVQKEMDTFYKEVKTNSNLLNFYNIYFALEKYKNIYISIEKNITDEKNHIGESYNNIISFLKELDYIILDENKVIINIKGVIASHINDCNAIILTELITGDYLNNLSPEEILGVLAIFIDDTDECTINDIESSDNIYNTITKINTFVNSVEVIEKKYNIIPPKDYWKISYDYVDITYNWASLSSVKETLEGYNIFEGNFIKNMLKLHNIIKTIISLCKLINKVELLHVFEKIEPLLVRDIVTVNSLYLS